ncbi:SsrA-binding protein SmpB [Rhabdochlamydiaceae symbiont of Dictyostelium giganteum]|uniref:SsrA-binding protein SmpB n=1 Tax=Rhabdochlamydiaceae symbiont of Dictyostelium giganteum TaxID=3342349 RepID=UPI00384BD241
MAEDLVSNRKAFYNYEILDTFEAGIVLVGTEVKSLRQHGGNLQESYVIFNEDGAYLKLASISPYKFGNLFNHEEKRERKLLLHKREISKLRSATTEKGLTVIALSFYLKQGKIKVKLALAKGKKTYDKRDALKKREHDRQIDRSLKNLDD